MYEKIGKKVDREVVVQYLQYPEIAKDFANYLLIYEKYQKDYQVEEILSGQIKETVYDKISRAAFDERLSLTGLLLSRLGTVFGEVLMQEEVMGRLMKILRGFREIEEEDGARRVNSLTDQVNRDWEGLRKQEILSKKEDLIYRRILKSLKLISRLSIGRKGKMQIMSGKCCRRNLVKTAMHSRTDFPGQEGCLSVGLTLWKPHLATARRWLYGLRN